MAYTLTPAPGTISISGSTITGTGTTFTAYKMGSLIFVKDIGLVGQLAADPSSDTAATLVDSWGGASVSGKAFEVYMQNDPAVYAKRVRDLLNALAIPKTGQNMVFDGSSTASGNPGAGKVRANSASNPTALYISETDADGGSIASLLASLDDVTNATARSILSFRPTDGASAAPTFGVTGTITDNGAWVTVPVTLINGTVPADKAALAMSAVPSGADGIQGVASGGSAGQALVKASSTNYDTTWAARREVLTADRTFFVRTDGSDSNNGLSNTSGGAFLTPQKAANVARGLDTNGFTVTVQVGAGTYTTGVSVTSPLTGGGKLKFVGDTSTPSNVLISVTSANCFSASGPGVSFDVAGFKVAAATSGRGLLASNGAQINIAGAMEFGACASHHMVTSAFGNIVWVSGAITVSGGSQDFANAQQQGAIVLQGATITMTGTPAFGVACVFTSILGFVNVAFCTFSGAATGARYLAQSNSVIFTNGGGASFIPGNSAGSTATGGQYI